MISASSRESGFVIIPFILFGVFIHLILLYSIFEVYYSSPIVSGTNAFVITNGRAPSSRLVFISADGLRWRTFSEHPEKSPFMQKLIQNEKAAWGISQSHVPTESRPGHVALMAGFHEDVSAVARGWRYNPVEFDSIANRASNLWMWGSHDITSLFADAKDSHLEHWEFYSGDEEDFASDDAHKLDSWVFDKVEQYFTKENMTNRIFTEKSLFFLHLLGLDTNGHGAKPHSAKYVDNIRIVDDGVKRMTELFAQFFPDNRTTFIFTADHGMTNWGAHGSGSDDEIYVPFVAWGAGIRASTTRIPSFIKQVDIAPLQAALLGTAIPCNSIGVVPLSIIDASAAYRFKAAYANLKQVFEQYRIKRDEAMLNSLPFMFRDYPEFSSAAFSNVDAEIRRLAKSQRFDAAAAASIEWIPRVRDAFRYFHQYKRFSQGVAITMLYIAWNALVYLMVTLNHGIGRRPIRTTALFCPKLFFLFVILLSALALFYQRLSFTNYLYYLMPVYIFAVIWNIFFENQWLVGERAKHSDALRGMLIVAEHYLMNTFTKTHSVVRCCVRFIGCLFFGSLILVAFVSTFYERRVLSIIFIFLAPIWRVFELAGDKSMHADAKKWERIWSLSCVLLCIFLFMDTVGNSPRPAMVIVAPFAAVELLRRYLIHCECVSRVTASKIIRTIQRLLLLGGFLSALNITFANVFITVVLRVFSWTSLLLAFLIPLIGLNYFGTGSHNISIADRLVVWMASIFLAYSTLSIAYESVFLLVLSLFLISMFRLEIGHLSDLQAFSFHSMSIAQNEHETACDSGGPFSSTEWRHAILLVAIVEIAFFGTGNIASLNSFNTNAIRNFVTVFSPFLMAILLITKILLPFLQTAITFAAILSHRSNIAFSRLAALMMLITDAMAVVFFFNLKDDGSWLDIGISISNYVICVISSISVFILLHIARLLIYSTNDTEIFRDWLHHSKRSL